MHVCCLNFNKVSLSVSVGLSVNWAWHKPFFENDQPMPTICLKDIIDTK